MSRSENFFLPDFSHVYLESAAKKYELTNLCLDRFSNSKVVEIPDYKTVFNRPGQDFQTQKRSMKLILAVKKPPFIYKGTNMLQDGGFRNFYYNTPILNCLYNCNYCFLQGMYPSANIVVFVNQEDMEKAVESEIKIRPYPNDPLMLSISYNTDLLAFENILPMTRLWIKYSKTQPDLNLEIRSKSTMFDPISDIESTKKVLLAWTLSPEKVVNENELDTPPLIKRLKAIQKAIRKGWRVRLCFDPIILYSGWEKDYLDLLNQIKSEISLNEIFDITVGVFRMGQDYFNRIRKTKPESKLYYQTYTNEAGVVTLSQSDREVVKVFIRENLSGFIPEDRIHFWD